MKSLSLSFALILSTLTFAQIQANARSLEFREAGLFCQGSELYNSRGRMIREFTFNSDCNEAVDNLRGGLTCADSKDFTKSLLIDARTGEVLKSFTFESDCKSARDQGADQGFACSSNGAKTNLVNFQRGGRVVYSFIFSSDCEEARAQIDSGLACVTEMNHNILVTSGGRQIRNFTFESDCQEMREKMLNASWAQ